MLFGETARKVCICREGAAGHRSWAAAGLPACGMESSCPGRGQEASRAGRDGSWGLKGQEKDRSFHSGGIRKWLLFCGRRSPQALRASGQESAARIHRLISSVSTSLRAFPPLLFTYLPHRRCAGSCSRGGFLGVVPLVSKYCVSAVKRKFKSYNVLRSVS